MVADRYRSFMRIVRILSIILAVLGVVKGWENLLFGAILILWGHNMMFSLKNQEGRLPFLLFHITFFTFLLGRPLLTILHGDGLILYEVKRYQATTESVMLALQLIFLSLIGLWMGAQLSLYLEKAEKQTYEASKVKDAFKTKYGKQAALIVFIASYLCEVVVIIEKVMFIISHSYVSYYVDFKSSLPYIIYVGSTFMFFSLCIWLAFLPSKKEAYIVLGSYVILRLPMAICGARTDFVLAILFSMVYFFFRDYLERKHEWVGAWEKRFMIIGATVGIVLLGILNYIREQKTVVSFSPFVLFEDFFFKQGVTFSWLCAGLAKAEQLRNRGVVSYTFGPLIDWLRHGTIARLLGADALTESNSIQNATESNILAHHLSWILLGKKKYLQGHGTGSCYILELFLDFRFWGVFLVGILLGMCLFAFFRLAGKSVWICSFLFMTINGFLYMPRACALKAIDFVWRLTFWFSYAGIFILGRILEKRSRRKGISDQHDF